MSYAIRYRYRRRPQRRLPRTVAVVVPTTKAPVYRRGRRVWPQAQMQWKQQRRWLPSKTAPATSTRFVTLRNRSYTLTLHSRTSSLTLRTRTSSLTLDPE